MGLKAVLVASRSRVSPASYVASHQQPDGGYAERAGSSSLELTAWSALGLRAAGQKPGDEAQLYLQRAHAQDVSDTEPRILALEAVGADTGMPTTCQVGKSGRIGPLVNSTIWGILALRSAGRPVPAATVRYLLGQQRPSGGWSWYPRGAPDSNDTAAAVQALRSAGEKGKPITRALAYLRRLQRKDGGFALVGAAPRTPVDGLGDPGFRRRREEAPDAAFRFLAGCAAPTAATATRRTRSLRYGSRRRCCRRWRGSRFR